MSLIKCVLFSPLCSVVVFPGVNTRVSRRHCMLSPTLCPQQGWLLLRGIYIYIYIYDTGVEKQEVRWGDSHPTLRGPNLIST